MLLEKTNILYILGINCRSDINEDAVEYVYTFMCFFFL